MAFQEEMHVPVTRSELPWAIRAGVIAGILAGIVFAIYEMVISAAMMGVEAFFMPLRMIGAILLGSDALDPGYPLVTALAAALVVHGVLSAIYGMVFAVIAGGLRAAHWDIPLGAVFGLGLWIVNFYLIAPAAFPWFLEANPVVQFIGHTVFFGAVLGLILWRSNPTAKTNQD